MQAIYLTEQLRVIEQAYSALPAADSLMARAGHAVAQCARSLIKPTSAILVLAGPGNNGGDALVSAAKLVEAGLRVCILFTGEESKLAGEALSAWQSCQGKARILENISQAPDFDLVVDGLFGIGLKRDLTDAYVHIVQAVNRLNVPVLAIDVPSGINSDSGEIMAQAIRATHTLTLIGLKPGLLMLNGPEYAGQVRLDTLATQSPALPGSIGQLLDQDQVRTLLKPRPLNSHKGLFGNVGILGGASGMQGAALLAGRAAVKLGAGKTYVGMLVPGLIADNRQPEIMLLDAAEQLLQQALHSLCVGPGLGKSPRALELLRQAIKLSIPLVLDADALNLISEHEDLKNLIAQRASPTLMTPHPAEAGRLMNVTTAEIQRDRVSSALKLASGFNSPVVLKGNGSVCAFPSGKWFINTSGNPGLASAGMGDVLSGMLTALLAQGVQPENSLLLAVHLHGAAADKLVSSGVGPIGLTASELIEAARKTLNDWVYGRR